MTYFIWYLIGVIVTSIILNIGEYYRDDRHTITVATLCSTIVLLSWVALLAYLFFYIEEIEKVKKFYRKLDKYVIIKSRSNRKSTN
jgi:hypothetical protein